MPRVSEIAAGRWWAFIDWFGKRELSENAVLLVFAVAIGMLGAFGVALFYAVIDGAFTFLYASVGGRLPGNFFAYRPLLTAAGLFTAWWIMQRLGRGHDGLNLPDVQLAVARRGGHIPAGPAMARTAASAVTIGAGGSAGAEGPVAVMGATLGSFLGGAFRFDAERVRVLVGAGAAAAISAAFDAPLAGAFFALEQILGSLAVSAFPPIVVASVVSAVIAQSLIGAEPAIAVPLGHEEPLAIEVVLLFPLLGVVTALMGVLFIRVYYGVQDLVGRVKLPPAAPPVLGGLLVGGLVLASGELLVGSGHLAVPGVLFGRLAWWTLLFLALGKIVATSLTLSMGGSGGVFTPCLYIGAATGAAFGLVAQEIFPTVVAYPQVYALVGMGALVVAATDAPLTGILLVFEVTNDYSIVLPLMLTTVVSYVVARHFQHDSLYGVWLRQRGESIERGTDLNVLSRLRVKDAFNPDPQVIREGETVAELLEHLGPGTQMHFPVVDEDAHVVGMISVTELGTIAKERAWLTPVLLAADVAVPLDPVGPEETLLEVTRKMGARGISTLPVADPATGRLLGVIDRGHVLAVYERRVAGEPETVA